MLNVVHSSLWETYNTATACHLPYGLTRCYLACDTGKCAPP